MEFEPARIVFPSVRLNQSYSSSLCISNPLSASVEFTIRPSSSRYTVTPDKVRLSAGQTIVVTVKLFLNHYPSSSKASGGHEDSLHVKSVYFDQKIPVEFFVHTQQSSSRSPSPNTRLNDLSYNSDSNNVNRSSSSRNSPNHRKVSSLVEELQAQLRSKDDRINELRAIVGNLESKYPNIHEVVRARVEEERNSFEEKSEKVSF